MNLKPYLKYRESGFQWIGEIPEGWEVNKIKNTSYVKGRIGWQGLTSEEYSDEGAYLVTGTNFKDGLIDWEDCHHVGLERYKEDPYIHLKENDLLITKDGTIGKIALIKKLPDKATLNSGIFLVRPLNQSYQTRFMYWMLNSLVFEQFFDYIKTGATIVHLYQETFERFFFPIPPEPEQRKISDFLDSKTSKINETIMKDKRLIDLLREKRTAIIDHAITKGLDKKAKMADSGIDWIGEVPETWNVKKLKFVARIKTGDKNTEDHLPDGKYPFFVRSQTVERLDTYTFNGEAVLTAGDGVGVGKVFHYYNGKFDYHQRVYAITHFKEILGKYTYYYLKNNLIKEMLKYNAKSTVDSLRLPMFLNFVMAFPKDINEQKEIIKYLDKSTLIIDKTIQKIEGKIALMEEYKKSLIHHVVTGQVDVREVAS